MFRCHFCQQVTPPKTTKHKVIVATREKQYPSRRKESKRPQGRFRVREAPQDPGGKGQEIAQEVAACPACAAKQEKLHELNPPPVIETSPAEVVETAKAEKPETVAVVAETAKAEKPETVAVVAETAKAEKPKAEAVVAAKTEAPTAVDAESTESKV